MKEKIINRSLLIAAARVLELFNNEDSDSLTVGEMREQAFLKLPHGGMLEVLEYFKSSSEFTINEDVENI